MSRIKECIQIRTIGLAAVLSWILMSPMAQAHGISPSTSLLPSALIQALNSTQHSPLRLLDGRRLKLGDKQIIVDGFGAKAGTFHYPLPEIRIGASVVMLPDGRILIWGGVDVSGRLRGGGDWFNPVTGQFKPASIAELPSLAGQSMTVLDDGQVLIAGGWTGSDPGGEVLALWNPETKKIAPLDGDHVSARMGQTAKLRHDGMVQLSGGFDMHGTAVAAGLRFDPSHDTLTRTSAGTGNPVRLTVVASTPHDGNKNVPADTPISVRFSRPVDPRSVSQATVSLVGPAGTVDARVIAVQNGRLAFVIPHGDLLTGTSYTVALAGVRGLDGQQLPFTAIGFRTKEIVVPSGNASSTTATGNPPVSETSDLSASSSSGHGVAAGKKSALTAPVTVYRSTGGDAKGRMASASSCNNRLRTPHLCRKHGYIEDEAWYPGQNNTGSPGNGRWRLNKPDISAQKIAKRVRAHHAASTRSHRLKVRAARSTTLSGHVEFIDDRPAAHVQVTIGKVSTYTNAHGNFTFEGVPTGSQSLFVDGSTADRKGHEYGQFVVGVNILAGVNNQMPYRMYLPRILPRDRIELSSPTRQDMVVTHPDIPGLEIHIPAGTVIRDHKGKIVTHFAIVPIPVDRAPYPTPVNFPVYFSLQPGGATVQSLDPDKPQGITLTYPNYNHVPVGTSARFIAYEPHAGWRTYGKGAITPDGDQLKPEDGVHLDALTGASWAMGSGHPNDPKAGNPDGPCCGDPVDLNTGTLVEHQTDAAIKDTIPIRLTRVWHALNSFAVVDASYAQDHHIFGGWRMNADMYVYSATGDWDDPNKGVRLPNGRQLAPFRPLEIHSGSDGTWQYNGTVPSYSGAILDAPLGYTNCHSTTVSECYSLTLRDGTQYWFTDNTGLYKINDRFGNEVTFTRNSGLLQQITSPSGRYFSFHYDSHNNVTSVTDNIGRTWTYSYHDKTFQAGGWALDASTPPPDSTSTSITTYFLDSVTYPDGTSTHYTYDEDFSAPVAASGGGSGEVGPDNCPYFRVPGTLLTTTDRNGETVMDNTYCSTEVVEQKLADGSNYLFDYHQDGSDNTLATDVTDPLGHVRHVEFDVASGLPSSVTRAYGTSLAQTTTYTHDVNGQVTSTTDALGRTTTYQYDGLGNLLQLTQLSGTSDAVTQSFTWTSDFNQIASHTDALGHTTTYTYTDGCLTGVTDPLGHTTTIHCNQSGQPEKIIDPLGHATTFAYQAHDLRSVTDALGHAVHFTMDALGRVTSVSDALGNRMRRQYDSNGRLTSSTDPRGKTTTLAYDSEGHVTGVTLPSGATVSTAYTPRYWVSQRTDALGHSAHWTYDAMGHVATFTDRKGQVTTYAPRDALGRFTQVTYADGSTVTADSYDAGNRLLQLIDSVGGVMTQSYDDLDRLAASTTPQGSVAYTYAANGLRTGMTAANQAPVTYSYDAANRLTGLTQGSESVSFSYDHANRRATLTLPDGITATYGYDAANAVTGITYTAADGSAVGDLHYTYDAAGRRTAQTGSLASHTLPPATTTDATFNLANEMTSFNGQSLTYDAAGNLTGDGVKTYVWNARNQLAQIKQGGTVTASFEYDALGRRIGKTIAGTTTGYLYDGANTVQEMQGTTVNPILTGLGIDERFARNEGTTRADFLTDALGSTVALADADGTLIQQYQYDPYGKTTATDTSTNPYQYTGRENDGDGLYYYRARYYSPAMGRFISEDPLGFAGGQNNLYAYVLGNPISLIDPLGLWSVSISWYVPILGPVGLGGGIVFSAKGTTWKTFHPTSIGFRGGIGAGGGFSFDPVGGPTDRLACSGDNGIGLYGEMGASIGPIGGGLGWNYGGTQHIDRNGRVSWHEYGGTGPQSDFGPRSYEGVKASAGVGVEITHYF